MEMPDRTGMVLIGRNEGLRLRASFERLGPGLARTLYVDSGSSDGSPELARSFGLPVVELDDARPHTAARARNAGLARLLELWPEVEQVQFLDGDCLLDPAWLQAGVAALEAEASLGLVTGVLRELYPERSVYNRLCDLEWNGPVGEIETCGGNAMLRVSAYRDAGGMNTALIAGEEADLHLRMRARGWRLRRIDHPMALHDSDLTEFWQWWKRNVRTGHACAEGAHLHGDGPEQHQRKETRSNYFWGLMVPMAGVLGAPPTLGLSSLLFLGYPLLYGRILAGQARRGRSLPEAEVYARYTVLGKVPQALGQVKFHVHRIQGVRASLMEYKHLRNAGTPDASGSKEPR
jgi:hypothetical protein